MPRAYSTYLRLSRPNALNMVRKRDHLSLGGHLCHKANMYRKSVHFPTLKEAMHL